MTGYRFKPRLQKVDSDDYVLRVFVLASWKPVGLGDKKSKVLQDLTKFTQSKNF